MTAVSIYFSGITILITCMIYSMVMTIKFRIKKDSENELGWFIWWCIYSVLTYIAVEDIDSMIKKLNN